MRLYLRGQGAMEYLMTYGWAILVIMVVGVAIWQLGMFNMGGSIPPTSSGFQQLKPFLATCEMRKESFGGADFIECTNKECPSACTALSCSSLCIGNPLDDVFSCQFVNAGGDITVVGSNMTVKGEKCNLHYVATSSNIFCGQHKWADNDGSVTMPRDSQILAGYLTPSDGSGTCKIEAGGTYDVEVDLVYNINIGGVTTEKHSIGTIHITST